jgi:hypothetical protein
LVEVPGIALRFNDDPEGERRWEVDEEEAADFVELFEAFMRRVTLEIGERAVRSADV